MLYVLIVVIISVLSTGAQENIVFGGGKMRQWTGKNKRKITAGLISCTAKKVVLKLKDGRAAATELDRLSYADVAYIYKLLSDRIPKQPAKEGSKTNVIFTITINPNKTHYTSVGDAYTMAQVLRERRKKMIEEISRYTTKKPLEL